jgi:hypothetical protein
MADEQHITAAHEFFVGEDKTLTFTLTGETITGWALSWMLKRKATDTDAAAKVTKTTSDGITITSATTCQVEVEDVDTDPLRADIYWHELKRTDAGLETILSYGTCVLRQSVHRA